MRIILSSFLVTLNFNDFCNSLPLNWNSCLVDINYTNKGELTYHYLTNNGWFWSFFKINQKPIWFLEFNHTYDLMSCKKLSWNSCVTRVVGDVFNEVLFRPKYYNHLHFNKYNLYYQMRLSPNWWWKVHETREWNKIYSIQYLYTKNPCFFKNCFCI
jgi:hypothetical protein